MTGFQRRILPETPRLASKPPETWSQVLQDWCDRVRDSLDNGQSSGAGIITPQAIQAGSAGAIGSAPDGWSPASHQHPVPTGVPAGLGGPQAQGSSTSLPRLDHVHGIPITTKGDLFGFSTLGTRVPIGTNGQILTADSTQALGLKWAAAPAGTAVKATKTLSNNVLTNLIDITPIGNPNGQAGGTLRYLIRITDGTHSQSEAGLVNYTQVFSNNVVQVTITKEFSVQPAGMVGTLAVTFAMVGDGAGGGYIQITSNTSFTTTLHEVDYVVEELSAAIAVPL